MKLLKSEVKENFTLEKQGNFVIMYDKGVWDKNKNIIKRLEIISEDEHYYNLKEDK